MHEVVGVVLGDGVGDSVVRLPDVERLPDVVTEFVGGRHARQLGCERDGVCVCVCVHALRNYVLLRFLRGKGLSN